MAVCTPSIHVFLGRPLFLLSSGIHSIINFGILSSGILLMMMVCIKIFEVFVRVGTDSSDLGLGSYECSNESSGSIKG